MPTDDVPEPKLLLEVLGCFARHPQRQDTLQGITGWWLMENRIEWALGEVKAALDSLVDQGLVTVRETSDGQICYKANPDARARIEERLGVGIAADVAK